jgi:ABC-2 type transport system ATP-binding protein
LGRQREPPVSKDIDILQDKDQTVLEATALTRYYGDYKAVDQVSFKVKRGEVLGFLGVNGAGKTTTLSMVTGVLAPSSGQVSVAGIDLLEQPLSAKACLGYLPETPPLYPEMTVLEYLEHCATLHRVSRASRATAVARVLELCELGARGPQLIGRLSKGYRQRVGIAQAIIHRPQLVVLDEPGSGLDPLQTQALRRLIGGLREESGVVLSTHIIDEALSSCDQVQVIHQGRLVFSGYSGALEQGGYRLRCRLQPELEVLSSIAGVAQVEAQVDGSLLIQPEPGEDPRPALAQMVVMREWDLLELSSQTTPLEQIFSQVSTGDPAIEEIAT